jgi:hypothetical protein
MLRESMLMPANACPGLPLRSFPPVAVTMSFTDQAMG